VWWLWWLSQLTNSTELTVRLVIVSDFVKSNFCGICHDIRLWVEVATVEHQLHLSISCLLHSPVGHAVCFLTAMPQWWDYLSLCGSLSVHTHTHWSRLHNTWTYVVCWSSTNLYINGVAFTVLYVVMGILLMLGWKPFCFCSSWCTGQCPCHTMLTHCGRVTQICIFTLQLCKTGDANLRF